MLRGLLCVCGGEPVARDGDSFARLFGADRMNPSDTSSVYVPIRDAILSNPFSLLPIDYSPHHSFPLLLLILPTFPP